MTELIDSLTIRGFRGFRDLTIPEFGKVNLITGKNNTGKSSVLEAIRILVAGDAAETLHTILRYREEIPAGTNYRDLEEREDFNLIRSLFLGFPDILDLDESPAFSIQVHGRLPADASNLTIRTTWISHRFGVVSRRHLDNARQPARWHAGGFPEIPGTRRRSVIALCGADTRQPTGYTLYIAPPSQGSDAHLAGLAK